MREVEVDVAIIGAGTAGLNARRSAEAAGARVVLIEGGPYGTTCARVGCMPSKLLIAAADVAHEIGGADRFGIDVDAAAVRVDGARVMDRVQRERDRFVGFVVRANKSLPEEQRILGFARFLDANTLQVDDHTRVSARSVVIATGSEAVVPGIFRRAGDRLLTNETVFEQPTLPASMVVIGAGVIGMELGQAFHRLGVRTTIISALELIGPASDPIIQAKAAEVFGAELDLDVGASVQSVEADDAGVHLVWTTADGRERRGTFDKLLAATGRRPNLARLELGNAGVALDDFGVPRFDPHTMQCGDLPIFIAGDVDNDRPLLHEASDEGRIAGTNAASFPDVVEHVRRAPLTVMFTDPQMAMVGARHADLDAAASAVGEVSYDDQGRSRVMGKNSGHVRIYGKQGSGELVGAEMLGPRVENTAHLLAWAVQAGLTVRDALHMPFYHPVVEEGIRTGLRDLRRQIGEGRRHGDLE